MKIFLIALAASSMLMPVAGNIARAAPAGTATKPVYGDFGFDTAGMDRGVRPGDDFYAYANGAWAKNTPIPSDRSNFGMFTVLDELSMSRSRAILDKISATPGTRIGDFYASFMDEAAVEAAGIAPLRPTLAAVKALEGKPAVAAKMGEYLRLGMRTPFRSFVDQDDKDPEHYIAIMRQGGLGLPDRDYYLKTDAEIAKTRAAYRAYLAQLLTLAGEPRAEQRAAAILAFETDLAKVQWTRVDSRDSTKTYNKWTGADFVRNAPGFDWDGFLKAAGLDRQAAYLVGQPSAFAGMAKAIEAAPVDVLKDYLLLSAINAEAPYLSRNFVDAEFAFNQTVLSGTPQNSERWKRGVTLIKEQVGEDLGQEYVKLYFTPETKAAADELVRNIIAAMGRRIDGLSWMSPETKVKARAKLAAFTPKIGYPSKWRDYSALEIRRGDLLGNVLRANAFEWQRNLNKLGKPIDRTEWGMTPMEINAYANFGMNEIVFPAAILQPPFFDPHADPAVNYGGIGAVIGHEISHHFDDQGAKYDMHGRLSDWWTADDVKRFGVLTDGIVRQYDAYEPLPGMHIQGALTQGENIADLAGLTVAYEAYQMALKGAKAPVIDGFTGDQRFYLGWAQVWRRNYREANLRQRLLTDPHSPSIQRAWVVRNLDPFYKAYDVKADEKMYLDPAARLRIW
ncbi:MULTISPECIES: M13 family metallopeptidase [unclassified Sphingomonas]|uniref:M13 family metallopeptidase n=1 Tax=unclassified Sphingomonas TaxID=196159 RepID=UPI0006FAD447|nr:MULTISPECIES: M13 family metallopeptidase [unclassified Sphingomonas]KQX18336.1 peptidase M13 [Sphingomonas sp. Root1294]KQY72337.1 peptidase M13 [Sphingomonas sp. Root50]KRB94390.1 peptidase M13 [Sphingomonas sp. Root720]